MKSIIKSLSSVKLAIVLLIIITLATMLGTFIPQQRSPEEYIARYGQLANLFQRLQLTQLYKSWWFIALLFLFSLNIIVCTLDRFSPKLKRTFRPRLIVEPKEISVLKLNDKLRKNMDLQTAKKEITILGWFGADIVHLGILTIIAGGIISGIGGFKRSLTFNEGNVHDIPRAEFKLRLEKFETELYPSGAVKDWKSTLTVLEEDKPVLKKIVEVNHPLSYKGYVFYQSGYGWNWTNPSVEIWVKKRNDPSFLKKIELNLGQRIRLDGENIDVAVLQFIPDFVIGEKGQITTRSLEPNNPAAFIEGWQAEEKIFSGWIFARFPDFDRIHSEKETDLAFELKNFKAGQYSVIQLSKDPGANAIWIGCAVLMIGLVFAFYWPPREIRAILEESHNKTEVLTGGVATKSKDAFKSEFEQIVNTIRRSK